MPSDNKANDHDGEATASALVPDYVVAEDVREAVWLRLRRLTSPTLCSRNIATRAPSLAAETVAQKGSEVASSVRSALGYWESQPAALNAKVLTRYYALLQISIAEQVASPSSAADLREIQRHTERGHGLWSIAVPDKDFPSGYMVGCEKRGHFFEYCRFKGIDVQSFAAARQHEGWYNVPEKIRRRLVSLTDLLRRIPELQRSIEEVLQVPALSFHIGHDFQNTVEQGERRREHMMRTGELIFNPPLNAPTVKTYIGIHPSSPEVTADFLNLLGLPMKNIRPHKDVQGRPYFLADFEHPSGKYWHECMTTYKSGSSGTCVIVPLWGQIDDVFLIHMATLYTLSIVVRYLPSLWHEIEDGKLDHIRALIELYLVIVDNVLPPLAIARITGRPFIAHQAGSLHAPM
jgi:hypothetical protein